MLSYSSLEAKQREKLLERLRKRQHAEKQSNNEGDTESARIDTSNKLAKSSTIGHEENAADHQYLGALSNIQPLQHAIQRDLILLQSKFVHLLFAQQQQKQRILIDFSPLVDDNINNGIFAAESVTTIKTPFDCFRQVARDNKMAGLYRFLPPRSDAASFSQLLYASCLDMLKLAGADMEVLKYPQTTTTPSELPWRLQEYDNGKINNKNLVATTDTAKQLAKICFPIFSLYMLHSTNPLPVAPTEGLSEDDAKQHASSLLLSTLPMNLTNRQNPRLLYRRNYRPMIRVDSRAFTTLLQVRDLVASWSASATGPKNIVLKSISNDLGNVLERLWSQFDLVAYVGPMGLHGLSQRQQLHKATSTSESDSSLKTAANAGGLEDVGNDKNAKGEHSDAESFSTNLHDQIQVYLGHRRELRLPPSNTKVQRFKRIRHAMQTMLSGNNGNDWESRILGVLDKNNDKSRGNVGHGIATASTPPQRSSRVVTFAMPAPTGFPQRPDGDEDATSLQNKECKESNASLNSPDVGDLEDATEEGGDENTTPLESFALVLPAGIPMSLSRSLETMVQTLVNRQDTSLFIKAADRVAEQSSSGKKTFSETVAEGEDGEEDDREGLSLVSHDARAALPVTGVEDATSVGTAPAVGRGALKELLARAARKPTEPDAASTANDAAASLLVTGTDDGLSAGTASAVGRGALKQLLAQAAHKPAKVAATSMADDAADGMSAETGSAVGRGALKELLAQAAHKPTKPAATSMAHDAADGMSAGTSSAVGRGALRELLAQAALQPTKRIAVAGENHQNVGYISFLLDGDSDDEDNGENKAKANGGTRKTLRRGKYQRKKKQQKKYQIECEVSEMSSGSDDDGGDAECASGTSALGRRALEDLLQEARGGDEVSSTDSDGNSDDDVVSASGASTAGQRALKALLLAAHITAK
ncbi:hypothetical protein ACA910_016926 [Epithemia clementina (nom. ined.)]